MASQVQVAGLMTVHFIIHADWAALRALEISFDQFKSGKQQVLSQLRQLLGGKVACKALAIELDEEEITLLFDVPKTIYWEVEVPMPEVLVIHSDLEKVLLGLLSKSFGITCEVRRCVTLFAAYKKY